MNLPNKISVFRIFLVFVLFVILYSPIKYNLYIGAVIFLIAAITDGIDGYIARSRKLVTNFGKFVDPLADKILVVSALVYLVYAQIIPDWMVIIIVVRDFAVLGLRILAASQGTIIAASKIAKVKTNAQIIAVIFALLRWPYNWWIMLLAVLLTLYSGMDYLWKGRNFIK